MVLSLLPLHSSHKMKCTAVLVLLVLVVAVCSRPASKCIHIKPNIIHNFRHVSDLANSSVAPWTWTMDTKENRDPERIQNAECKECTVPGMIAKPIYFQVHVYIRDGSNCYKRCPYEVAVGCTCVRKQQQ